MDFRIYSQGGLARYDPQSDYVLTNQNNGMGQRPSKFVMDNTFTDHTWIDLDGFGSKTKRCPAKPKTNWYYHILSWLFIWYSSDIHLILQVLSHFDLRLGYVSRPSRGAQTPEDQQQTCDLTAFCTGVESDLFHWIRFAGRSSPETMAVFLLTLIGCRIFPKRIQ